MSTTPSRRQFLQTLGLAAGAFALTPGQSHAASSTQPGLPAAPSTASRPSGSRYMGGFKAPKLDSVKLVFIGLGGRGMSHLNQLCHIDGVEILGVCDLKPELTEKAVKNATVLNGKAPKAYSAGPQDYQNMLKELKPDAAIISTDWASHAPIAIASMKNGAHAFVEVPLAPTLEELWEVVDTSEATQKHCMMMENVNYGREELLFINMCRQGLIGELTHGEAAYIHNLRGYFGAGDGEGFWRPQYQIRHNGNMYPTHGLGPVAQYMNLARGEDQFNFLISLSSPPSGSRAWTKKNLPADHKWNKTDLICGDINNTIIKTALGRTILVQWDEMTPRPYSRLNLIQGTQGALAGFPTRVSGENIGDGNFHEWTQGEALGPIFEKYEHPLWKRIGDLALKAGGHGGMDFVMLYRMIECLRNGEALDQNVYEGAFWSSVMPLSWQSVKNGGTPVTFPDFTRGDWKTTAPLDIIP